MSRPSAEPPLEVSVNGRQKSRRFSIPKLKRVLQVYRNFLLNSHLLDLCCGVNVTTSLNQSTLEIAALQWLEDLGYEILHGPDIAAGEPAQERELSHDVLLAGRLRDTLLSKLLSAEIRVADTEKTVGGGLVNRFVEGLRKPIAGDV